MIKKIEVLYEDDECLVVNKPEGLPVQGGSGAHTNLDDILKEMYSPRPLLTHRLDKDTSGAALTAKSRAAAARFSRAMADGTALKQYLAICRAGYGAVTGDTGTIDESLTRKGVTKEARTRYRRLAENGGFALYRLELGTGRTHQIRRHLAQNGLPVLGDRKYGDFALNRRLRREAGIKRLMLHAFRLALPLPNGRVLDVRAPLPDCFTEALKVFGMEFEDTADDGLTGPQFQVVPKIPSLPFREH
ncbi:MAG: RluA family pseudouridine synthase [Spirochaetaceae bacterium]|nr:RluA family pseudouridine synthase [Spirochaetaceae bacterium]